MASNQKEIYIFLLNEGVDVWRPTLAEETESGVYKVLPTEDYDHEDEEWEFLPGAIVRCEERTLSEGQVLVAVVLGS